MKYGFEREYFCRSRQSGEFIPTPLGCPSDACGYLAEARGEPHTNPKAAAALLLLEQERITGLFPELSFECATPQKLPPQLVRDCLRAHGKQVQSARSLSGRWNKPSVQHAGLHVHFSNQSDIWHEGKRVATVCNPIDMPALIYALDRQYGELIRETKRAPGQYEMKPYGFEYRSLPASADPQQVAAFIATIKL